MSDDIGLRFEREDGAEAADARVADATLARLLRRMGEVHLRQRLRMEAVHPGAVFGYGRTFFHLENWYSMHALIRGTLRLTGLYARGVRNARALRLNLNEVRLPRLPAAFAGFRLLHLSDLHLDMAEDFAELIAERVRGVEAELTVLTGDFRYRTHGDYGPALAALARLRPQLPGEVYAVLGNHDSVRMVPAIEDLGIRVLLNEHAVLERGGGRLYLAGVDDPHYFGADNLHRAAEGIPWGAVAVLLAHSPELYREAAACGFDLMLCGHTHGGQVCLPGGFAPMTNADCPRAFCRGGWRYRELAGYTSTGVGSSVVGVRYNCPPEVALHILARDGD